jgi:uncharacterized membrane protein YgaE (UPF0421/DUF939 family)
MISETATELVRGYDPTMFWIAVAILIILFVVTFLKKSIYV